MVDVLKQNSLVNLNYPQLDDAHQQLADYAQQLNLASDEAFPTRFLTLLGMIEEHFADEERMMEQCDFRHAVEHKDDHLKLLQEVRQLLQRRQPFARAYIRERLPERLNLHISRMDSMLSAALNQ